VHWQLKSKNTEQYQLLFKISKKDMIADLLISLIVASDRQQQQKEVG
tara:strand:- start:547 stop:687 length:141 start_codon:yes stop_codon:yes gene_type:complete